MECKGILSNKTNSYEYPPEKAEAVAIIVVIVAAIVIQLSKLKIVVWVVSIIIKISYSSQILAILSPNMMIPFAMSKHKIYKHSDDQT